MNVNDFFKAGVVAQMMNAGTTGRAALLNFIGINLFEIGIRTFPTWSGWFKSCIRRRGVVSDPTPDKAISATVTCERTLPAQAQGRQQNPSMFLTRLDAVIHYVANSPVMKNLLSVSHHDYLPNDFEPILIDTDIYFQMVELKVDDGALTTIKFKLFCYDHDVRYLQRFIENCNVDYERRMANKLGTNLYFFDQMTQSKNTRRSAQNPLPQSHLVYTKHVFSTTRSFDNVYFEQQSTVRRRTEFFLKNRTWYEKKGIPYTLGFLFHGDPGCGKTSETKAIAHVSRRHIINIQLSEIKTKSQLRHLFFNDEIHVYTGQNIERYTIPIQERLYVIEDIDAMGDVVLERRWKKPTADDVAPKKQVDPLFGEDDEVFKEPIDLAFLLNLLDGTLEANGRMMIITSNFPERIDRALIRPGRIDMSVKFRKCNRRILREIVEGFYDLTDVQHELFENPAMDYKWSPAEVNQILFQNFDDSSAAMDELLTLNPRDLYGFRTGIEEGEQSVTAQVKTIGETVENGNE